MLILELVFLLPNQNPHPFFPAGQNEVRIYKMQTVKFREKKTTSELLTCLIPNLLKQAIFFGKSELGSSLRIQKY